MSRAKKRGYFKPQSWGSKSGQKGGGRRPWILRERGEVQRVGERGSQGPRKLGILALKTLKSRGSLEKKGGSIAPPRPPADAHDLTLNREGVQNWTGDILPMDLFRDEVNNNNKDEVIALI